MGPGTRRQRRATARRWRAPAIDVEGPRVRLGVAWAAVLLATTLAGPLWLALWLTPAVGIAAAQAASSWRKRRRRPVIVVAALGAAALPLAAWLGIIGAAAVAVLVVGAAVLTGGRRADPRLTIEIALVVGLAGAGPVLLRGEEPTAALVLVSYALVYDASAFVVGSGAGAAWEGPAAGLASIAAVSLAVAALFVPPFRGASPWLLGGVAAVLTPLGPMAGSALLGDGKARVPALRRIDSLLVLGPVWAVAAALLTSD